MKEIHSRAQKGINLLMVRQVCLQVVTFGGGIILARVLGPSKFGLYAIASFLVAAFAMFSNFGLAPALIQRKEELTDFDLRVAFTLQQVFTTIIVCLLVCLAPWLAHFYPKAPPETPWLVRALAFNLYLTTWRTMSALQLERHLKYDKLARIEVIEMITYQGTAVAMALCNFGVWSYIAAIIASGTIGTILVYAASPWKISFAFDKMIAAQLLRFGVPFQAQAVLNNIGGWVTPIMVGSMIGPQAVGYLSWSSSNGKKPLMLVDNVMRVAFPHLSRIQHDFDEVIATVTKYLTWLLLAAGLWSILILMASHDLVRWIYSAKWTPAVPSLILYSFALIVDVISFVGTGTLNSLGKVRFTLRVYTVRTICNITMSIGMVYWLGFNGIPIAYIASMLLTTPWLISGLGRPAAISLARSLVWIVMPIAASFIVGWLVSRIGLTVKFECGLTIIAVVVTYALFSFAVGPYWVKATMEQKFTRLTRGRFNRLAKAFD